MAGMLVDLNVELAHYEQGILLDKWIFQDEPSSSLRLDAWKEKLQECDACIMMFWKSISPSTEQELKLALEYVGQEGFLKRVIVFFKSTEQDDEQVSRCAASVIILPRLTISIITFLLRWMN